MKQSLKNPNKTLHEHQKMLNLLDHLKIRIFLHLIETDLKTTSMRHIFVYQPSISMKHISEYNVRLILQNISEHYIVLDVYGQQKHNWNNPELGAHWGKPHIFMRYQTLRVSVSKRPMAWETLGYVWNKLSTYLWKMNLSLHIAKPSA